MSEDPNQLPPRYSWRTLLQAVGIGIAAQTLVLLLLTPIASHQVALAASSGVFFAAVWFWSPVTRQRRYWVGFLVTMVVSALLWVLTARLLSQFRS